jgi:hypothetical protein
MTRTWWLSLLAGFALAPTAHAEAAYIGAKACKPCHVSQYKSWETTSMAKAFELLKPGVRAEAKTAVGLDPDHDYTTDETCLPCHTTGYGAPGGYGTNKTVDAKLQGVGCEMCHGAGGDYVRDDRMSTKNEGFKSEDALPFGLVPKPDETRCTRCHQEKSPFYKHFVFAERVAEGTHEHFKDP